MADKSGHSPTFLFMRTGGFCTALNGPGISLKDAVSGDHLKTEGLPDRVKAVAGPVADDLGLGVVDVVYTNVQDRWVLRIFIDKPGGVTLDDCGSLSRELGTILDVEEVIPRRYSLEVSSPGLDRVLNEEKDFARFAGKKVNIKTKDAIEGRKNFKATLAGVEDGSVVVTDDEGRRWIIAIGNIEKANLVIEL